MLNVVLRICLVCLSYTYAISSYFHLGSVVDFCDASYECRQPCPTGFDAECPSGYRCFANTPCNANVRSMSANMLDYGLPMNALNLMRQYTPEAEAQAETNASSASSQMNSGIVGILFGIALICVVALNIVLSRKTST